MREVINKVVKTQSSHCSPMPGPKYENPSLCPQWTLKANWRLESTKSCVLLEGTVDSIIVLLLPWLRPSLSFRWCSNTHGPREKASPSSCEQPLSWCPRHLLNSLLYFSTTVIYPGHTLQSLLKMSPLHSISYYPPSVTWLFLWLTHPHTSFYHPNSILNLITEIYLPWKIFNSPIVLFDSSSLSQYSHWRYWAKETWVLWSFNPLSVSGSLTPLPG